MNPTIEIDQDIYDYLLSRVMSFSEMPSDVIRRELSLGDMPQAAPSASTVDHELSIFLSTPDVTRARGVVGKFLAILGKAYSDNSEDFSIVLTIQGRGRTYFAKSEKEIEASGNSTQPKQIPGSPYWVMTNSPTSQKRVMVKEVLEGLGYSSEAVKDAVNELSV